MKYTIQGKIERMGMPQSIPTRSGDTFQKQEVWLDCTRYNPTTGEAIPNTVAFEFGGKYMELLQNFAEGDSVTITFDIQGYKYEKAGVEKIFTKLQPINIEAATEKKPEPKAQGAQVYKPEINFPPVEEKNDLPF